MNRSKIVVAEVFHPREAIRDELKARKWSRDRLAIGMTLRELAINRLAVDMILDGPDEVKIGKKDAALIAQAFGVSAELFLNMQKAYDAYQERSAARGVPHAE